MTSIRVLIENRVFAALFAGAVCASAPFVCALPAHAQGTTATASATSATVNGVVVDPAGKPLGGASVTVTSAVLTQTVRSGPDGRFSIAVPPDTYVVTVSSNGFATSHDEGVTVTAGQSSDLKIFLGNLTLQTIGRVTARNSATSINTAPAASSVISSQTFVDQGQTQVVNVLDQIPGVEINRDSSNAPGANTSISIRGAQPYESQVLIDGHPVVSSANGAAGFNGTFINSLLIGDVEVNKGPGNLPNTIEDAVGGTLNFRTPTITAGPTGTALAGYNSFNGEYYALKASDTFGKLGLLIGIADNKTPGYLAPQTIYGGAVYPGVSAGTAFAPHVGVLDFGYPATQNFDSQSQLAKLSYDFSPRTSLLLEQYSTQTNNDETGTNYEYVDAKIVPCIDAKAGTAFCPPGDPNGNYTSNLNGSLIGSVQPINLYAPYPSTTEFDNEPIYSAEFRTVIGPGSLLARYYTGAINRIITQIYNPVAVIPCTSPACPTGNDLTKNPPYYGSYQGEPYVEDTIDVLHGFDAQYTLPFGANNVTFGFDRHTDTATFGEYDPTEGPPSFTQGLNIQSLAYNVRGTFQLARKLTLDSGNYLSNTTYVGTRFDLRDGLVYRVNPNAAVRASYGSAYVAPYYGIIQPASTFAQGALTLATGPFRPETSSGYDIGTDFNVGRNTLVSFDGYLTNVYNRYASVTTQPVGETFGGQPVTSVTQEGNQAAVREEGLELDLLRAPRIGFGFHSALDILRDYAHNQDPAAAVDSLFSVTPGNFVQLPTYPYFKMRNDIFYSFGNGALARFSGTSYGENNAFGEPGFTEFDTEIRLPLKHELSLNVGGSNLFNHDDYQAGGIYDGGPTIPALGGGIGYSGQFFAQPRTLFLELERNVGPGGSSALPRSSL